MVVFAGTVPKLESRSAAQVRELYERYGASVYGRCRYLLKERAWAEDAMHDVFAQALQNISTFRAEASALTWLMKIATHHCLNLLRSKRSISRERFEREEKQRVGSANVAERIEARDQVLAVLGRLDIETQAVAVHYFVDEMTLEEVARALGRSVPTVRKRLDEFRSVAGMDAAHD